MFIQKDRILPQLVFGYFLLIINCLFFYFSHFDCIFPLVGLNLLMRFYMLNGLIGIAFLPFIFFFIWNNAIKQYKEAFLFFFHGFYLECAFAFFAKKYTGFTSVFLEYPCYFKSLLIYSSVLAWSYTLLIFLLNYIYFKFFYKKNKSIIELNDLKNKINKTELNDNNFENSDLASKKKITKNLFLLQTNKIPLPDSNLLSIGVKEDICINIEEQKSLLVQILKDFNIDIVVRNVFVGPVVSLYSIELMPGIKASSVISLSNDIARLMKVFSVRVCVVPGENLLGVEIANPKRQVFYLKEGILSKNYIDFYGNLPIFLGVNIFGEPEVFDLSEMPHLLVAGTTGSGKSVGIHTILLSLLFKKTFNEVKFILIDPKKLELTPYNEIPHLLFPVVTDPLKAIQSLHWAVKEMERRYELMAKIGVRNIVSFNEKIKNDTTLDVDEIFEFIVIVIDELADLMFLVGKEFEMHIQRLAQMGRAAGLHLIIATQRPSVDVITGTIKANFPTRVSFKLASKIDSRTILGDMSGAEQLLGSGDMLLGINGKLTRIHGSFVSEEDVLTVVNCLKKQKKQQS